MGPWSHSQGRAFRLESWPSRRSRPMTRSSVVLAVLIAVPALAFAQKPAKETAAKKPLTESAAVEATATIDAIDHTSRLVTLRDKDGNLETVYAGPEIKRFDELKV